MRSKAGLGAFPTIASIQVVAAQAQAVLVPVLFLAEIALLSKLAKKRCQPQGVPRNS
jgi:hypothetical protein